MNVLLALSMALVAQLDAGSASSTSPEKFDVKAPVEIGRVVPDGAAPNLALVLEATQCAKRRRKLEVVLRDGDVERGRVKLHADYDISCALVRDPKTGGVEGGVESEWSRASAKPFQLDAKERALFVEMAGGFEHIGYETVVVTVDVAGAGARKPRLAYDEHLNMGMGRYNWSATLDHVGDHDELVVTEGMRYGGSLPDTVTYSAQRLRWDASKRAFTSSPQPVWAVIVASANADEPLPKAPPECAYADVYTEAYASADFALLAKGKRIQARMVTTESEANELLAKAREKCAKDAYVKRAR